MEKVVVFFVLFFHLDNLIILHRRSSIIALGKRGNQATYFHKRSDKIDVLKLPRKKA